MIVHMIGNAHIDPVWLWRWQDGADEALATFRSAADRCDEYPEFIFTRGEAWLFEQVERIDPELFARVRDQVGRGQWHITGGQYLQPDTNHPTELGWRKQFELGRRYFQDRFGVTPTVGYNVDSFGHPATLPDLLAELGYLGYVFHRPAAHQVKLPRTAFRWQGAAGGEVLAFRLTGGYVTRADDLYGQVMLAVEAADPDLGHTMCFYGVGNHGGGPTKGNIEYILANATALPGIELRFSTPQVFFEAIAEQRDRLPVVSEELQHTFPGCYSVMHDIKQAQRHGEHVLGQAERAVATLVEDATDRGTLQYRLDGAWKDLLFTQFHDILSGTSIPSAWPSVRAMQGRAWITGEEVIYETTRRWARRTLPAGNHPQLAIINLDEVSWRGMIEAEPFLDFDSWGERWVSDLDGNPVDYQLVQPEASLHTNRIIFPAQVPARGCHQVLIRDDVPPAAAAATESDLIASPEALANGHLSVALGPDGIVGITWQERDLLGPGGIQLHLREDHADTWGSSSDRFDEPAAEVFATDGWAIEETGPLRARARAEGWLGHSAIRWTVSLHRDEPLVHLLLEINFSERFRALQLATQLTGTPVGWTDGQAGGQVERTPNGAEWPVQGWSRLDLGDVQVALVTQDAYSLRVEDDRWQWTLLRSPKMAWMGDQPDLSSGRDWYTDQGPHTFAFVLHVAETLDSEVLTTVARHQARPPVVFNRYEGLNRPPWGAVPPRHLWTDGERHAANLVSS